MMKCIRLCVALIVLAGLISGCGGQSRYTIVTDADGSLAGVRTNPRNGDYDIPVSAWIQVYWPLDYEPPAEFTFTLRNESGSRVWTYLRDGTQQYEWWFEPRSSLDYDSRYKIEIQSGESKVVAYFWTRPDSYTYRSPEQEPDAGPRRSAPLEEHTVRTLP